MGGGSKAPAPPDYTPIANADTQASQEEYQLGQQQLAQSAKEYATSQAQAQAEYNQQEANWNAAWPYAQKYLSQATAASRAAENQAAQYQNYWNTTFQPMETSFANTAANYNSPGNAATNAGLAEGDVANQFNQSRMASLQNLESYGIDPSQTHYGALDLATRIAQASAVAAAGTQSRLNTQATALALQGDAIDAGQGIQANVGQSYAAAIDAGSSGLQGANSTISTGNQGTSTANSAELGGMSTANQAAASGAKYYGLGNNSLNNATNALHTGFSDALGSYNAQQAASANLLGGIGSMVGTAVGALAFL